MTEEDFLKEGLLWVKHKVFTELPKMLVVSNVSSNKEVRARYVAEGLILVSADFYIAELDIFEE